MLQRPQNLVDVLQVQIEHGKFDDAMREFLDEFYIGNDAKRAAMIREEPALCGNDVIDAYVAAAAEHLAREYKMPIPPWVFNAKRCLEKPFFAGGLENLKAILLAESPLAFRRRMLFVEANALYRPRKGPLGRRS